MSERMMRGGERSSGHATAPARVDPAPPRRTPAEQVHDRVVSFERAVATVRGAVDDVRAAHEANDRERWAEARDRADAMLAHATRSLASIGAQMSDGGPGVAAQLSAAESALEAHRQSVSALEAPSGFAPVAGESELLAVFTAPLEGGARVGFARKQQALEARFDRLAPADRRILAERMRRARPNDPIAVAFSRLTETRRASLLAHLATAGQREAQRAEAQLRCSRGAALAENPAAAEPWREFAAMQPAPAGRPDHDPRDVQMHELASSQQLGAPDLGLARLGGIESVTDTVAVEPETLDAKLRRALETGESNDALEALFAEIAAGLDGSTRRALAKRLELYRPGGGDDIAARFVRLDRDLRQRIHASLHADAPARARPLPEEIRGDLEAATGTSLSHVRLHGDERASEIAAAHGARAVAIGRDIYVREDQLDPTSPEGRELIAHEVAHVVQADAPVRAAVAGDVIATAELEADDFAASFRANGARTSWRPTIGIGGQPAMRAPAVAQMTERARAKLEHGARSDHGTDTLQAEQTEVLPEGVPYAIMDGWSALVSTNWLQTKPTENLMGMLRQMQRQGAFTWATPEGLQRAAEATVPSMAAPTIRYVINLRTLAMMGLPPLSGSMVAREGDNLMIAIRVGAKDDESGQHHLLGPDDTGMAFRALEAFTSLPARERVRLDGLVIRAGMMLITVPDATASKIFGHHAWKAWKKERGTKPGSDRPIETTSDLTLGERSRVEGWLRANLAIAEPGSTVHLDRSLLNVIDELEADPALKPYIRTQLEQRTTAPGRTAGTVVLEQLLAQAKYQQQRVRLGADQMPGGGGSTSLDAFEYSVPARITQKGLVFAGRSMSFKLELDWEQFKQGKTETQIDEFARRSWHAEVEWVFERTDKPGNPAAIRKTYADNDMGLSHAFRLDSGEQSGVWMVHAFVRTSHLAPMHVTTPIAVKTEAARMEELRDDAMGDMMGPDSVMLVQRFDLGITHDLLKPISPSGKDPDADGYAISGSLPKSFQAGKPEERAQRRAEEIELNRKMALYLKKQQGDGKDGYDDAIHAAEARVKSLEAADAKVKPDESSGWRPFEIRGTYLSRNGEVPSGPLELYGFVKTDVKVADGLRQKFQIKVRDLSSKIESDLEFTDGAEFFDEALRSVFLKMTDAYPEGRLSVLAEDLTLDATLKATPNGRTIGYERPTTSAWKRAKSALYNPVVQILTNAAAMALMIVFPPSAAAVMTVLAVTDIVHNVDDIYTKRSKGKLKGTDLAIDLLAIGLDVLPAARGARVLDPARSTLQELKGGVNLRLVAFDLANFAGQTLVMYERTRAQLVDIQDKQLGGMAERYRALVELESRGHNESDADLVRLRLEIENDARAVRDTIRTTWAQAVSDQATFVVGSHLLGPAHEATPHEEHGHYSQRHTEVITADEPHARPAPMHDSPATGHGAHDAAHPGEAPPRHAERSPAIEAPPHGPKHSPTVEAHHAERKPAVERPHPHADRSPAIEGSKPPTDHAATIDAQIAGPGHAQTDLHSHWMGNVPPEQMAAELARSGRGAAPGDVSPWEPLLRELATLRASKEGAKLAHGVGDDGAVVVRGQSGDALALVGVALKEIDSRKATLPTTKADAHQRVIAEIDRIARSAVEKALRASDETDFNSSYEIRDELVKAFYGTADRAAVIGDATTVTAAKAKLLAHFEGRPTVQARVRRVAGWEKQQAKGKLAQPLVDQLGHERKLIFEQFAYDRYSIDTVVRLAKDQIRYTEQSNSVKKLLQRFDEGQLAWVKQVAAREHPELAADLAQLTIKHLAMITTNNFGNRNADLTDVHPKGKRMTGEDDFATSAAALKKLAKRGDVAGIDVAGIEHFQFDARGRQRFQHVYGELLRLARARGEPVVFRPHVGEGGIDTTTGMPFATDANRQQNPRTGELTHVERGRKNLDEVLVALEGVAARFGGTLPPDVVVRFGHATQATPAQAERIQRLGIIVEVNLTSNQVTGAQATNVPAPGHQDRVRERGTPSKPYGVDPNFASEREHALKTMIFSEVDVVLSTDGHEVMNTTLKAEFDKALGVIADVRRGDAEIEISVGQARGMNRDGGTAVVPVGATETTIVRVTYAQLSVAKQHVFDRAYRKFFETAQAYLGNSARRAGR